MSNRGGMFQVGLTDAGQLRNGRLVQADNGDNQFGDPPRVKLSSSFVALCNSAFAAPTR